MTDKPSRMNTIQVKRSTSCTSWVQQTNGSFPNYAPKKWTQSLSVITVRNWWCVSSCKSQGRVSTAGIYQRVAIFTVSDLVKKQWFGNPKWIPRTPGPLQRNQGQQDDSGVEAHCQFWKPEFDPQNIHDRKKLTVLWLPHVHHGKCALTCIYTCTYGHILIYNG